MKLIKSLTVRELRKQFPTEDSCHRSMLGRIKSVNATVSSEIRKLRDFLIYMGPRPGPDWTVDRINNADPEYAPKKIKWADKREQSNNRRNTRIVRDLQGVPRPVSDIARQMGIKADTIRKRLRRGATHEEALRGKTASGARKLHSASTEPLWPIGSNAAELEKHYLEWLTTIRDKDAATREVFYGWLATNNINRLNIYIDKRFGKNFEETADRENLRMLYADKSYIKLMDIIDRLSTVRDLIHAKANSKSMYLALTGSYRDVFLPSEAAAAIRKRQLYR